MKRAALTIFVIFAMMLASCSSHTNTLQSTASAETTAETTFNPYAQFESIDLEGKTFTGLIRTQFEYEFNIETETGDVVNDAVYTRELIVENTLNADLKWYAIPGAYPEKVNFVKVYSTSVAANDGSFDYVAAAANYLLPLMSEGVFVDLSRVPSVSLDMPWYSQGYIANMNINGRLYLVTGSAAMNCLENMCVLFFNKNLMDNLGNAAPYEAARNGSWTFDKLNGLARDTYSDLNGNGNVDDEDRFGYLTYNNMLNAQLIGMGLSYIKMENGLPAVKQTLDEPAIDAYNAVESFMNDSEATYHYNDKSGSALIATETMMKIWDTGNVLFFPSVLSTAVKMRGYEFDFGILPFPKYDEKQASYHTFILENVTVIGISPTSDIESAGYIIDMLSSAGYNELDTVYFDTAMKDKYSRDNDTREMLDIIRENVFFEYPLMTQFVGECIFSKKPLVSTYESKIAPVTKSYEKLIQGCMELE